MGQETFKKREDETTGGQISRGPDDELVDTVARDENDKPIGQDHSTEDRDRPYPDRGVGNVQDREDRASDKARIEE